MEKKKGRIMAASTQMKENKIKKLKTNVFKNII